MLHMNDGIWISFRSTVNTFSLKSEFIPTKCDDQYDDKEKKECSWSGRAACFILYVTFVYIFHCPCFWSVFLSFLFSPPLNTSASSRRACCQITIMPTSLPFTRDSISLSANMAEWREATRPAPPWRSLTSSLEYEWDWHERSRFAHAVCSPYTGDSKTMNTYPPKRDCKNNYSD